MASQSIAESRHGISVGSVFGRSVDIIRGNPVATLGVAFAFMALPRLVLGRFGGQAALVQGLATGTYAVFGVYALVAGLLWLIASGALVHAAIAHDEGRPADLREVLLVGVQRALPLLAVDLLFVFGVWLGCIALLVPGIMLAVMWAVALPAVIAERPGVFGAFGRSRALTRGARWHVFGIMLLAGVIYLLASAAVGVASVAGYGSIGALAGGGAVPAMPAAPLLVQLLQAIVTTVMLTWFTMVGAALFIELRHWKDGPGVDRLSEIFA